MWGAGGVRPRPAVELGTTGKVDSPKLPCGAPVEQQRECEQRFVERECELRFPACDQ